MRERKNRGGGGRKRADAEAAGFAPTVLYKAKDALHVDEYRVDGRKWWKLPFVHCPSSSALKELGNSDKPPVVGDVT
jgi:hypothetical protein